ncbi:MAG: DEAD/DEAH box helicase [Bacteroidetes bacterium]|nr:DEAD/DEAH box helicase [Bacteroidota bacterium]
MNNTPKKTIIVTSPSTAPGGAAARKKELPVKIGLLLNFGQDKKGGLSVEMLLVMEKKDGRSYQRIPLTGAIYKTYLSSLPPAVALVIRKLADEALVECLVKGGFAWIGDADKPFESLDERHYLLLRRWMSDALQELKPLTPAIPLLFYLRAGEPFMSANIRPASISTATPSLRWVLERKGGYLSLRCSVEINNGVFPLEEFQRVPYFLKSGNEYFLLKREDSVVLDELAAGAMEVREEGLPRFLTTVVRPLAERYPVDMDAVIRKEAVDVAPSARVYVSELNENFLLIKPKWLYGEHELEEAEEVETRIEEEDKITIVSRKREVEQQLMGVLRSLHMKFEGQTNGYFYLNFKEALEKSWFLRFYQQMQQMDIPVLGMSKLRKFKYNTNVPQFEIIAGRSIDWFDLTIRVSYGDLVVPLNELRKAILGRQDYILLSDGSLGLLPKEWLDKYSLLLRMGQMRDGGMRLPAVHWAILQETGGGGEELRKELEEKKRRLLEVDRDRRWPLPAGVKAQLRDYQLGGFQWMCLLDDMGWGGCLADDMGLGKTLQTLSFLQHLVETYPDETHLVVCPTSLLYNWEGELKKFVPGLDWHIHYGADRELDEERFRRAHVIITSYGMVRNDIEHFSRWKFGYLILDESQAIKNPASQVRKAIQQLQARNRLALSGTPVQNNTFDLYAQMDFLNPGMLGSPEFFRTEFATPIDRSGDKEAALRLRRLVYPFILRRTKEQVARDLPDRTEMILWCEMGDEQRKIYNSHKEHYRESLLDRIAEEGVGKSSIYILEGLTKLRQICDSPAMLKDGEYPNVSAKLEELVREIEENTGEHKVLVFSQFTSMLGLIRGALDSRGIGYLYLDGGVSAEARRESVERFQESSDMRVFLISLKAGGVGLTLTAADYVYLVDPWWNPAAEQQAIDRSHRIGQQKKVFAYRMICKDSVEEKILQLQERKRALAADLVADEGGFVKQLTQEDVAYLFS